MARIAGINLPLEKKIEYALPYIYGVGHTTSKKILVQTNVDPNKRVKDLSDQEIKRISNALAEKTLEGDLRQTVFRNIKRLKDIKSYRGIRHKLGLPVRGQQTRTNAVTRKGRNIAVGGLKRKLEKT
ncbi:30S ribosomal protein S13 [Candidatus Dojkabacteria bacterium]|jgi:small subunit ribosomal protein S13|uniref:Small ribosomal subunit protein uS13 n=1 Tax=Candidatus Dojkabacteria bacterium TaxID=2099670 RepID=A0A955I923_9BACT|nr:30S ribosomal protein S13 [Candidatus Dojkabacteria bacterium]